MEYGEHVVSHHGWNIVLTGLATPPTESNHAIMWNAPQKDTSEQELKILVSCQPTGKDKCRLHGTDVGVLE